MKNDLIKFVMTLSMTIMCFSARAEYDFQVNGLYYKVISLEDLTCACVDKQNGPNIKQKSLYTGNISIPSKVTLGERVFTVVEVGESAFLWSDITSVKIPESVKIIRRGAFSGCKHLQSVVLEDGINIIEPGAFSGCWDLKYVTLPNTLQKIGYNAFSGCYELSCQIVIPSSCEFVGSEALPAQGKYSVRISDGSSPLEIYKYGLGNGGIDTLYIGRDLSIDNYYVYYAGYQHLILGDNVTTMPECPKIASDITNISTLIIGKSITTVPLIGMLNIKTIHVRSTTPPKAEGFLDKVYLNSTLYVPKGSLSEYQNADVWGEFWTIKEVEMR